MNRLQEFSNRTIWSIVMSFVSRVNRSDSFKHNEAFVSAKLDYIGMMNFVFL